MNLVDIGEFNLMDNPLTDTLPPPSLNIHFLSETLYHGDFEKQDFVVNKELSLYRNKCGSFGISLAIKGCEKNVDKFAQEDVVDMEFEPDVYQEDPVFYEAQLA
ncbi:unnamed protein product [Thlaspi arvense]|uniref:Uncharacterized protein n=1 Tax=Thlaspi arvense TaxID=13288 RepID=A0AAU9SDM0_THLAR|nr:unnamed protein product [Thlaspi arvense]